MGSSPSAKATFPMTLAEDYAVLLAQWPQWPQLFSWLFIIYCYLDSSCWVESNEKEKISKHTTYILRRVREKNKSVINQSFVSRQPDLFLMSVIVVQFRSITIRIYLPQFTLAPLKSSWMNIRMFLNLVILCWNKYALLVIALFT